ncbi:MAG TPA: malate dehydrogenase (quinone) [Pseudogracilibacillus sp.]|nr:malate dehydrogenase (quinone) [Pseudogracilibacillus sp.]
MVKKQASSDVIMIGAGIMSATLGSMLKEVDPEINITLFEKLSEPGAESSNEWNNAGTGHAALCELNYTSENKDGSVDISKAVKVNEEFQVTKQFWSYLVDKGLIKDPKEFIRGLPHISLVHGEDNVAFLNRRYRALSNNPLFKTMEFSDDVEQLKEWIPLIMQGRKQEEPIAATKVNSGTDVNFGELTRKLLEHIEKENVGVNYNSAVEDIKKLEDGRWEVKVRNTAKGTIEFHTANFIFIGAGGAALPLLQKTGIPESRHLGGFPVSGVFFVCNNPEVSKEHYAKVYGKAAVGAPPMSVPHLDTRYIEGERTLMFGPFAGFSPKFLKTGSNMDLLGSVKPNNVFTMLSAGAKNLPLTKYLVSQLMLTKEQRMEELRQFIPTAKSEDWDSVTAGQRVQVIKDTEGGGKGTLQFGTELVKAEDGSIAALLGASPGASTAVEVMINLMRECFPDRIEEWEPKLKEMIPSYGKKLADHEALLDELNHKTDSLLELDKDLPVTK